MRFSRQAAIVHVINGDESALGCVPGVLRAEGYDVRVHQDAAALIEASTTSLPACVVAPLTISAGGEVTLVETLRACLSSVPVIVLISQVSLPAVVAAVKAGAFDVIEQSSAPDAILGAVRTALGEFERAVRDEQDAARRVLSGLTRRERAVFRALVAGKINRTIGQELGISPRTVEVYRAHIMRKARVESLSELTRLALKAGVEEERGAWL